jgi:RNA polymerase sigma-70 factor (ECF subfamily)
MEDALQRHSILSEPTLVVTNDSTALDAQFIGLVERHSGFIFRVAYAVLRNSHDAEDVVQETFLKLYRGRAWRDIQDEPSFLARMAWRIAVGRVRRRHENPPSLEMPTQEPSPEVAAIHADRNAIVHRLIDALPEDLRQPLALSALEELDSARIAVIMAIPEGTVRTRIMRARSILKRKLATLQERRHAD